MGVPVHFSMIAVSVKCCDNGFFKMYIFSLLNGIHVQKKTGQSHSTTLNFIDQSDKNVDLTTDLVFRMKTRSLISFGGCKLIIILKQ